MKPETLSKMKKEAAVYAVDLIKPGMAVGLGTGSTAIYAIEEIARRLDEGLLSELRCIPSSEETKVNALSRNIKVYGFDTVLRLDINIDGADEIDKEGNLIKGGGGALLREKVVAQNCDRNVVIVDETKHSEQLGEKWHLPVEVLPFCWQVEAAYIESLGAKVSLRLNDEKRPLITDQQNYILDCSFGIISDPPGLSRLLEGRAGIIENGLFINTTHDIVTGNADGVEHKKLKK